MKEQRMTFPEAAKKRMLEGGIELVQNERGVGVKYDSMRFTVCSEDAPDQGKFLYVQMYAGDTLINEVELPIAQLRLGYSNRVIGIEGVMYFTLDEIKEPANGPQ